MREAEYAADPDNYDAEDAPPPRQQPWVDNRPAGPLPRSREADVRASAEADEAAARPQAPAPDAAAAQRPQEPGAPPPQGPATPPPNRVRGLVNWLYNRRGRIGLAGGLVAAGTWGDEDDGSGAGPYAGFPEAPRAYVNATRAPAGDFAVSPEQAERLALPPESDTNVVAPGPEDLAAAGNPLALADRIAVARGSRPAPYGSFQRPFPY